MIRKCGRSFLVGIAEIEDEEDILEIHYADDGSPYVPLPPNDLYHIIQLVPDPVPPLWKMGAITVLGEMVVLATGLFLDLA